MYISHPFRYLFNDHIALTHLHLPHYFHVFHLYKHVHLPDNFYNLPLSLSFHFHKKQYILLHLLDNSYNFPPLLFFSYHNSWDIYLTLLHIFLINPLNMYYNILQHLSPHFHNQVFSHYILYTSMYIFHPFNFRLNYHIPLKLTYPLFHPHMYYFYIFSHLLNNSYNPLLTAHFRPHTLLHILTHLPDNSYNLPLLLLFSYHILLHIVIHPPDSSDNFPLHLLFHFNTNHTFKHLEYKYYMFLSNPTLNFNNKITHPADNSNNFPRHLLLHFNNLNTPSNFLCSTQDNHPVNFTAQKDIHPHYQLFHLDQNPLLK